MSGVLAAMATGAPFAVLRVTIGASVAGVGTYNGGTVSPDTVDGHEVIGVTSVPDSSFPFDFVIEFGSPNLASLIRRMTVEDSDGNLRVPTSISFVTDGATYTNWLFGDGSNPPWTADDAGNTRTVALYR